MAVGCKGRPVNPPYGKGAPPDLGALVEATQTPLSAIRVGRAKIRERSLSATLMYVVQGPDRFAGTIQIAGNELVSLAVNEQDYHLRLKSDRAGNPGYYSGPPSSCAVARLVGVALEPKSLVSLLLGGVPLVTGELDPQGGGVTQRWNRAWPGREELELRSETHRQRLRFAYVEGAWHFAGTRVWVKRDGEYEFAWAVDHIELHRVGGHIVPRVTTIETPRPAGAKGRRGEDTTTLTIKYLEQSPDPSDLMPDASDGGDGGDGGDGWVDTWDDDWGEQADGSTGDGDAASPEPPPAPPEPIPQAFVLDASGLPPRGDLCQ